MREKTFIDIIILSYAKNENLKKLTIQTINTLIISEDPEKFHFNVLVIESNKALKPYQYRDSTTIYPNEKFGFNKYLNLGIKSTSNNYLCLCNNDLIFHEGWASSTVNFFNQFDNNLLVTSPFCQRSHINFAGNNEPVEGYFGYFAGYCFFTNRMTLNTIGDLDERINFWFSDLDFIELMKQYKISHFLIPDSKVDHVGSQVTNHFSKLDFLKYTEYPNIYFNYKWNDKSVVKYYLRLIRYFFKFLYRTLISITNRKPA